MTTTQLTTGPTTGPLRFAYWVPNVSGGLVTSTIEQRTDWSFDYNRTLARLAERAGFDYALSQVRYTASYGAEFQHESTSFSLALLMATERLKLIAAVHPGLWHPGVLAKWVATADHLSGGRVAVNVVSGWFSGEFRQLGEPWLEHDERYRRTAEFILALKRIWTEDEANLAGDFYRIRDFSLKPKPLSWPGRPHPEIFQGGNSSAAQRNGGQLSDWYFSNGKDFDGVAEQLANLRQIADAAGRTDGPRFGLNGFVIVRDTEREARDTLREIIAKAHVEAVEGFGAAVKQAVGDAIIQEGGTITHHHAVGRDHRPWYDQQRPDIFASAVRGAKDAVDPAVVRTVAVKDAATTVIADPAVAVAAETATASAPPRSSSKS